MSDNDPFPAQEPWEHQAAALEQELRETVSELERVKASLDDHRRISDIHERRHAEVSKMYLDARTLLQRAKPGSANPLTWKEWEALAEGEPVEDPRLTEATALLEEQAADGPLNNTGERHLRILAFLSRAPAQPAAPTPDSEEHRRLRRIAEIAQSPRWDHVQQEFLNIYALAVEIVQPAAPELRGDFGLGFAATAQPYAEDQQPAAPAPWRVGARVPEHVYDGNGRPLVTMPRADLAARVVAAVNGQPAAPTPELIQAALALAEDVDDYAEEPFGGDAIDYHLHLYRQAKEGTPDLKLARVECGCGAVYISYVCPQCAAADAQPAAPEPDITDPPTCPNCRARKPTNFTHYDPRDSCGFKPAREQPAAPEPSADDEGPRYVPYHCPSDCGCRSAEAQLAAVNEVAQRAEKRVGLYPGLKGSTYYAAYLEILALLVRGATPATSPGAGDANAAESIGFGHLADALRARGPGAGEKRCGVTAWNRWSLPCDREPGHSGTHSHDARPGAGGCK